MSSRKWRRTIYVTARKVANKGPRAISSARGIVKFIAAFYWTMEGLDRYNQMRGDESRINNAFPLPAGDKAANVALLKEALGMRDTATPGIYVLKVPHRMVINKRHIHITTLAACDLVRDDDGVWWCRMQNEIRPKCQSDDMTYINFRLALEVVRFVNVADGISCEKGVES